MKTRMERYQELREKLSSEVQNDTPNNELSQYAKRLNEIDKENFEDVIEDDIKDYEPTRVKDVELKKYETFENEYLKDFLDEVKEYNIEKGHRHVDDTEQNILEEISAQKKEEPKPTSEPLGFEDLGLVDEVIEPVEPVTNIEEVDFESLLKEVTREHDVILDEEDDEYKIGTTIEPIYEAEEAIKVDETEEVEETDVVEEELVDEIFKKKSFDEEIVETNTQTQPENLIDQLASQNFLDNSQEPSLHKTNEMDLNEIFQTSEQAVVADDEEDDHDPFWEDYLRKMNELEENSNVMYESSKDELNFPTGKKTAQKKIMVENEEEEPRDITAEFLALTQEIEKENLTSIDLDSTSSQKVVEEPSYGDKMIEDVEATSQNIKMEDYDEASVIDETNVKNNRLVNAALTVALAGIVLGVAVAVKYFILG